MLKPTPSKPGLFSVACKQFSYLRGIAVVTLMALVLSALYLTAVTPQTAAAATNNTINFQARLETSSGAIVPDGNYNVEFKLYNVSSAGTAEWTEDYLNSASQGVHVANGYLTVNLGSITSFPTTINWDQQQWLTMNIGGTTTGSVTWDGEMNPRLQLTAVPYALRAGAIASTANASGYESTLSILQPASGVTGNEVFQVPDMGAAGTYALLTAGNVSGATTGVALQSSTPGTQQTGSFNISGTGIVNTLDATLANVNTTNSQGTLTVAGSTSDSSALGLVVNDANGNDLLQVRNDGQITLGKSSGTASTLGKTNIGASPDTGYTSLVSADKVTTGPVSATVNSISTYVGSPIDTVHNSYYLGIYTDNSGTPGTLVATSTLGTLTAGAWNTLPVSATLSANTSYWLAFFTNTTQGTDPYQYYDTTATTTHAYMSSVAFAGGLPSTFTASGTSTALHSIYATVSETGSLGTTLTVNPTTGVSVMTPNNITSAFNVQNASGSSLLTADTTNMQITTQNLNIGSIANNNAAGRIFSDSFESGNFNTWTTGAQTSGTSTVAIDTSTVHNGKYAVKFNETGAAGSDAYLQSTFSSTATTYSVRSYIYFSSLPAANLNLFRIYSSTSGDIQAAFIDSAGKLGVTNNGAGLGTNGTALTTGAWHEVEMRITLGTGTSGSISIYLDGVDQHDYTGLTTYDGTNLDNRFRLGEVVSNAGTYWADDFVIDSGANGTGLAAGANVAGSLHVSGNSSFGGAVLLQPNANTTQALLVQNASSSTVLDVDTTNNRVGINTGSPNADLQVNDTRTAGNTAYEVLRLATNNSGAGAGGWIQFADTATSDMARILGYDVNNFGGGLAFYTKNADGNGGSAASERMRIDASGNVGIGTTSTSGARLNVSGTSLFQTSTNSTTAFQVQNASGTQVFNIDTSTTLNLLPEAASNFETGDTWAFKGSPTSAAQDATKAFMGSSSLKIVTSTTANAGAQYAYTLSPSTTYTLSLYVLGNSSFSTITIGHQDQSGTDIDCLTGQSIVTGGWTRLSCSFTTGATISSSNIYIKDTGTSHTFWVDGVQLEANATSTAYNVGGQLQLNGIVSSAVALKNVSNSTTALTVENAAGTQVLNVDTTNNRVVIGSGSSNAKLYVVDTSTGTAALKVNEGSTSDILQLQNNGSTVASVSSTGAALFQNSTDSTNALQVKSHGGSTVLNVDTSNGYVGVGTASPGRFLDVAVNNTQIAAPMALLEQAGTGDSSLEFKDPSNSVYIGQDASSNDALVINSSYAATHARGGSPYNLGYTSVTHSFNDSSNNGLITSEPFTTTTAGTISQISVDFSGGTGYSFAVAIYADSGSGYPGTLLATSPATTITANGIDNYNTATLSSTVTVSASTKYWIAYETNNGAVSYWLDNTQGNVCWQTISNSTFGTWTPLSSTSCDGGTAFNTYGIYAVVNPTGSSHSLTDTFSNPLFNMTQMGYATFQGMNDSASAFVVQNPSGVSLLTVNTTASTVQIGSSSTDSTAILLALDSYNQVSDPPGTNGAMYYNTSLNRFRCYENNEWKNCIGIDPDSQREDPFFSNDFLSSSTDPWQGGAVPASGDGSFVHDSAMTADHPGVEKLEYSANSPANSGYYFTGCGTDGTTGFKNILIGGGENFETVFRPLITTNDVSYIGFIDNNTATASTNGVYVSISGSTLTGTAVAAGTASNTASTDTLNTTDWYTVRISINSNATLVTFTVTDTTANTTWTDTVSTNIPTSTGTTSGVATKYTTTSTSSVAIMEVDYMALWYNGRALNR